MDMLQKVKFAGWLVLGIIAYLTTIMWGVLAAEVSGPLTVFSNTVLYIEAIGFGIAAAVAFFLPPGYALWRGRY